MNQRSFSVGSVSGSGYPPSLPPPSGNLSQHSLSRFLGSKDSPFARRPMPRDSAYSPWGGDANSRVEDQTQLQACSGPRKTRSVTVIDG